MRTSPRPVRIGIIGVSGYAAVLASHLQPHVEAGRARWRAAASLPTPQDAPAQERLREQGAYIYDEWRTMIEAQAAHLDLLIIATAIHVHREMAVYALERGLRVFLEKPLAGSLADALAIEAAQQQGTGQLLIGYQHLFSPFTHWVKQRLINRELGPLQSIRSYGHWPRKTSYYSRNNWAGRLSTAEHIVNDSPVNNAMAHPVNLMLFWAGATPESSAQVSSVEGSLYRAHAIESFDTASLRIHTHQGIPLDFHGTHSCRDSHDPEITITCSNGSIRWTMDGKAVVKTAAGCEHHTHETTAQLRERQADALVRWAGGEGVRGCTLKQAIEQSRVVDLIHAHLPINTVADPFLQRTADIPAIAGIEDTLRDLYKNGALLQAGTTGWAVAPALAAATHPAPGTHTASASSTRFSIPK